MSNKLIEARDQFAKTYPEARVDLNGRDWGVIDVGTGPVLLLIPGTLGRGDIFWQQIEALSDKMRIIAISYPSAGSIEEWSEDLSTLLKLKDISSVSLLGSSLGGYLAQYFASLNPQKIIKLFAANTLHSVQGLVERPPYCFDLQETPIETLRDGFGTGLKAWGEAHPDQLDLVDLLLQEAGGRILEAELRMRLSALKFAPDLPPNTIEVVTIESSDDPLIPAEIRDAVRSRLSPDTAYRFLSGGHFPYVVRPDHYTALLERELGLPVTGPEWGEGSLLEK
ncbi:MAG: alpha/beta hydrolase [Sneathiella sp.]|nr:alpha/beta hydrolase [Sneathiella sp.]